MQALENLRKWGVISHLETKREDRVLLFDLLMPCSLPGRTEAVTKTVILKESFILYIPIPVTSCCTSYFVFAIAKQYVMYVSASIWESSILTFLLLAWFEIQVCEF